jgi:hypothetical protein
LKDSGLSRIGEKHLFALSVGNIAKKLKFTDLVS